MEYVRNPDGSWRDPVESDLTDEVNQLRQFAQDARDAAAAEPGNDVLRDQAQDAADELRAAEQRQADAVDSIGTWTPQSGVEVPPAMAEAFAEPDADDERWEEFNRVQSMRAEYRRIGALLDRDDLALEAARAVASQAMHRRDLRRQELAIVCRELGEDPAGLLKGTGVSWTGRTRKKADES